MLIPTKILLLTNLFLLCVSIQWLNLHLAWDIVWLPLIKSLLDTFKKVSSWVSLSEYFGKPLEKSAFMGSFRKSISVGDYQTYLGFLNKTFGFLEKDFTPLLTCVEEPHLGKTYICREIKFIIVVKVFNVSCVSFKDMFSVHYGKCILPTYPR